MPRGGGRRGGGFSSSRSRIGGHRSGGGFRTGGGSNNGLFGLHWQTQTPEWTNPWPTGLFGCFSDIGSCLDGAFCCYCQMGTLAHELIHRGQAGQPGCCSGPCWYAALMDCCAFGVGTPIVACHLRSAVMGRYQIGDGTDGGGGCGVCCTGCWCPYCSNCQVARTLTMKGEFPGKACFAKNFCPNVERPPVPQRMDPNAQLLAAMGMGGGGHAGLAAMVMMQPLLMQQHQQQQQQFATMTPEQLQMMQSQQMAMLMAMQQPGQGGAAGFAMQPQMPTGNFNINGAYNNNTINTSTVNSSDNVPPPPPPQPGVYNAPGMVGFGLM